MKSRLFPSLLMAAVAVIGFTAMPTTAEAGGSSPRSFSHKCGSCGGSIYKKRVVSHRDRCGRPVYGWNRIAHRCSPVRPPVRHGSCRHGHGCNSCGHSGAAPIIFGILNFIAEQSRNNSVRYDESRYDESRNTESRYDESRNTESRYDESRNTESRKDDGYRY